MAADFAGWLTGKNHEDHEAPFGLHEEALTNCNYSVCASGGPAGG